MSNVYLKIPEDVRDLPGYVLAQVIRTSGSTPQKPGSSALFNRSGLVAGTVGGGVLEGKVQEIAMNISVSDKSGVYVFNLDKGADDGEDALCGGRTSILIDSELHNHADVFKALKDSFSHGIPGMLVTQVVNTYRNEVVISRYFMTEKSFPEAGIRFPGLVESGVTEMLLSPKQGNFREIIIPSSEESISDVFYLESVIPPPRLLIAGAGHIGKALAKICQMIGFEVTVVDDRPEFANADNIPWTDHIISGNIGKAVADTEKGKDLYIVIVTRGHRDDADALRACISSDTAYVGMIGSKTKVELMRREFMEKKWATPEQWSRIYSPIGLDINSKTVEEIAVSIAAQLILIRNNPKS
jgi:xanthine dehydrogenase accessory factor